MNQEQWLASADAREMIEVVRGKGSPRLWRLFAVACARNVTGSLPEAARDVLRVAERFADGAATAQELRYARAQTAYRLAVSEEYRQEVSSNFFWDEPFAAAHLARRAAEAGLTCVADEVGADSVDRLFLLPYLLREIFGNPSRWADLDPAWLAHGDGAARKVAETNYEGRSFESLPVLADALEDAGCADDALLAHLRSRGPHFLGCWALDFVLDKG